jgi:lipid-binding SYLF domain-containing protein
LSWRQAFAEPAVQLDSKVDLALEALYKSTPAAKKQAESAKGILVIPDIIKAGLGLKGSKIPEITPR